MAERFNKTWPARKVDWWEGKVEDADKEVSETLPPYEREFPYLNHKWSDGEKLEWFEARAHQRAEVNGHSPATVYTRAYIVCVRCSHCDLEAKLILADDPCNKDKKVRKDIIRGDLLEQPCPAKEHDPNPPYRGDPQTIIDRIILEGQSIGHDMTCEVTPDPREVVVECRKCRAGISLIETPRGVIVRGMNNLQFPCPKSSPSEP